MSDAKRVDAACGDLGAAIVSYEGLGFRLDMITPADEPRLALMSGHGIALRLELEGDRAEAPRAQAAPAFAITRAQGGWVTGRAGMQYRDLIPGRLGGRVIASQIRIPDGGPVPDYVHYHHVAFQMIYCRKGWVRVVYEDQGPAFVMHEGDCVLQPPTIRHRVLEASAGLEVIEVSAPAAHETWRDHDLELPTAALDTRRVYGGQRFVRHVAANATRQREGGFEVRDSGIATASAGAGGARVLTGSHGAGVTLALSRAARFLLVLGGQAQLRDETLGTHQLNADDSCVLPAGVAPALTASGACEVMDVALPLA